MNDIQVLDFVCEKITDRHGGQAQLAEKLGISTAAITNWRADKRISARMRPKVWQLANELGADLPVSWLVEGPDALAGMVC